MSVCIWRRVLLSTPLPENELISTAFSVKVQVLLYNAMSCYLLQFVCPDNLAEWGPLFQLSRSCDFTPGTPHLDSREVARERPNVHHAVVLGGVRDVGHPVIILADRS